MGSDNDGDQTCIMHCRNNYDNTFEGAEMNTQDIWSIASAVLVSVGGASIIVASTVEFIANRIAHRLDQKYQAKLEKDLEKYKFNVDHCRYVTTAQFDREFEIYQKLSESFFRMVVKLSSFVDREYDSDTLTRKDPSRDEIVKLITVTSEAQNLLYSNAAFIPKDIYDLYDSIMEKANTLFWNCFEKVGEQVIRKKSFTDAISEEDKQLQKIIEVEFHNVNAKLREYLSILTIVE